MAVWLRSLGGIIRQLSILPAAENMFSSPSGSISTGIFLMNTLHSASSIRRFPLDLPRDRSILYSDSPCAVFGCLSV